MLRAKISYLLLDQHLFNTVQQWICDKKLTETKVYNDLRSMIIFPDFYWIVCGQKREYCVWEVDKGNLGQVPLCGREWRTKKGNTCGKKTTISETTEKNEQLKTHETPEKSDR